MTPSIEPDVAVVVVTRNGLDRVGACVEALRRSEPGPAHIIVVDDGSADEVQRRLADELRRRLADEPAVTLLGDGNNRGPAVRRNQGAAASSTRYLAFLDDDTRVAPDWLPPVLAVFRARPDVGLVQCGLIRADSGEPDTHGHFLTAWGVPIEAPATATEVFGGKSAALIVERDLLLRIGGFDETYVIYGEDTDVCWRARLAGRRTWFVRESRVEHDVAGSLNRTTRGRVTAEGAKNGLRNILKNAGAVRLLSMLPLHVAFWGLVATRLALKGRVAEAAGVGHGLGWNARHLRATWQERRRIQGRIRTVPDSFVFAREVFEGVIDRRALRRGLRWLARL